MTQSKCPKCGILLSGVNLPGCEKMETSSYASISINAISFYCPGCKSCLGMSANPVSVISDTASAVVRKLAKSR